MSSPLSSAAPAVLQTAHTHLVKTLYRQVIKLQLNWVVDRDIWRRHALEARRKFEAKKSLTDQGAINSEIYTAQKWIKDHWHPDPYNIPTQWGGSSFQRNVAPPLEILDPYHGLGDHADEAAPGAHH